MQILTTLPAANADNLQLNPGQTQKNATVSSTDGTSVSSSNVENMAEASVEKEPFGVIFQELNAQDPASNDELSHIVQSVFQMLQDLKQNPEMLESLDDGSSSFSQLKALLQGNDFSAYIESEGGELPLEDLEQSIIAFLDLQNIRTESNSAKVGEITNALKLTEDPRLKSLLVDLRVSYDEFKQKQALAPEIKTISSINPEVLSSISQTRSAESSYKPNPELQAQAVTENLLPTKTDTPGSKLDLMSALDLDVSDNTIQDKQVSTSKVSFSEIQAKVPDSGLKPYSTMVQNDVFSKEWPAEVSQKIVWMTGRNIQTAEVHLNPAELGPIEVKISVQNDAASITFNAQHASVRDLLETNVQRLREMMEEKGVELSDVNVDSGKKDEQYQSQNDGGKAPGLANDDEESELQSGVSGNDQVVSSVSTNLVDYFV